MANIVIEDREGLPEGSYDVSYYLHRESKIVQTPDADSNVPLSYIERLIADKLGRDDIVSASCTSQPGGVVIAGSERAASAARSEWGL